MDAAQLAQRYGYPQEYNRYDTQFQGQKEAIGWAWYDTMTYVSAGSILLTYFNVVRANLALGNMEVAGQLASPKAFFMRAIRVKLNQIMYSTAAAGAAAAQTGAIQDQMTLIETGILQLTIGQKIYGQWPLWMLPAGGGNVPFAVSATATVAQVGQNGFPDSRVVYSLSKPLFIAPQINFKIDLMWPAGAVTTVATAPNIVVAIDGDLIRPVQ